MAGYHARELKKEEEKLKNDSERLRSDWGDRLVEFKADWKPGRLLCGTSQSSGMQFGRLVTVEATRASVGLKEVLLRRQPYGSKRKASQRMTLIRYNPNLAAGEESEVDH
jgi:hypothetical protein